VAQPTRSDFPHRLSVFDLEGLPKEKHWEKFRGVSGKGEGGGSGDEEEATREAGSVGVTP
jgi:hypothetical protein